jgi:uncharacterized protein
MKSRSDFLSYPSVVTPELVQAIRDQYAINWQGIHGITHFQRVRENGLKVARLTGAIPAVVELFAFLHDSKRINDARDSGHGARGAAFAKKLKGSLLFLSDHEFDLLVYACEHHTDGKTEGDITVQTCWDADRLDLWRASIWPKDEYLCTEAARSPALIQWASSRIPGAQMPDSNMRFP